MKIRDLFEKTGVDEKTTLKLVLEKPDLRIEFNSP
jgi:phage pi2 protein 07